MEPLAVLQILQKSILFRSLSEEEIRAVIEKIRIPVDCKEEV